MPERVAILVIHGIGQQRPYETLDHFTRNLKVCLDQQTANDTWDVEPQLDQAVDPTGVSKSWIRAALHLYPRNGSTPAFVSDPNKELADIILFEYYWAPITQDKISYRGSILFLLRAGLTPFFYLAANISAIGADSAKSMADSAKSIGSVILREIWRQICFFLPLIALLLWLLYWLATGHAYTYLTQDFKVNVDRTIVLGILAVRYLYVFTCYKAYRQCLQAKVGWQSKPGWRAFFGSGVWIHLLLWPLLVTPLLRWVACAGSKLASRWPVLVSCGHWSGALHKFITPITNPLCLPHAALTHTALAWREILWFFFLDPDISAYFRPAVTILLSYFVRKVLTDFIGDIAVYANSDTFASSYAARSQILEQCSSSLAAILLQQQNGKPKFDRVLIAAHSLGSVIAYDTVNQLRNTVAAAPISVPGTMPLAVHDLQRLRGLVTFGCPLNKFYYFFRELDNPDLSLHDQIVDLLHGYRVKPVGAIAPPVFACKPPQWLAADQALDQGFRWINAYSKMDPISGKLLFYKLNPAASSLDPDQLEVRGLTPFVAHTQYWTTPSFYTFIHKNFF